MILTIDLDDAARAHLLVALTRHIQRQRVNRFTVPADFLALRDAVSCRVGSSQESPNSTGSVEAQENCSVVKLSANALVDRHAAAATLGVSVRTLDRLVAAGQLAAVHIGRSVRFRPIDLEGIHQ